jgi:predicted methyltransferase
MKRLAIAGVMFISMNPGLSGFDPSVVGKSVPEIDPAVVLKDLPDADFNLESEADILRNPSDNLEISVFDATIRWQSDRSVLKFRK